MKNIILAEDHKVIRYGLKMLLESTNEYKVIYDAGNGQEVLNALDQGLQVDLIVSDIGMPVMDGIAMIKALKENQCEVPVLIISMLEDDSHLYQAIGAGAKGFLTKSVDADELFFALSRIISGERYICSGLSIKIIDKVIESTFLTANKMHDSDFSSREIEILQLIGQGLTNAEMADKLFISRRTVEGHRQSLIDKTGAKNTAVLMRFAYTKGIIN
ncbi:response regulator transcription factor [Pedobacter rhizosphaerae]|uniref:Two component transcriptional regulator, LuxR family n=1 Tax=Pedobacter rhizosphaerae TaxID=390241 RepID=A0A1H9QKJ2_9SPHI|nr:response regulator transcription factor [Pedobacter rhizosphaerae]SER61091.1 two component transcriptional regulator, LuxR family [Pedobacter rhizosphaerae]